MIEINSRYLVGFTLFGPIWFDLNIEKPQGKLYPCSQAAAKILTAPDRPEWPERYVIPVVWDGRIVVITREEAFHHQLKETSIASWT